MENTADIFVNVTELAGDEVSREQVQRIQDRYCWAAPYCQGKDVLEIACGTGQGLGYLARFAKSLVGGDISPTMVDKAKAHYQGRVDVRVLDAMALPFPPKSFDVIILFEAIYYLPNFKRFVAECQRLLRPGGYLLIATANRDLFDFNPSPHSVEYYGVTELQEILVGEGFHVKCFGTTPVESVSARQKVLRPIKKFAVEWNLIPKTMAGKKLLKRMVFGKLVAMPAEIDSHAVLSELPVEVSTQEKNRTHKVILCEARLGYSN